MLICSWFQTETNTHGEEGVGEGGDQMKIHSVGKTKEKWSRNVPKAYWVCKEFISKIA